MGWFLSAKSKNKSKSSKRGKGSASVGPSWEPEHTLRALKVAGAVVLAAGVAAGWWYGERALVSYASQTHASYVESDQVSLVDAPPWMNEVVRRDLRMLVAERVEADPLSGDGLRRAAAALADEPWVREVEQVRRVAGGGVQVRAAFREPVAVLEGRDPLQGREGFHLVDAEHVRLPGLYLPHQVDALGLPVVVGVNAAPPRAGAVWEGADVAAGVSVARFLAGQPYAGQIEAYDVSRRDRQGRVNVVLHTRHGRVIWGLPPGDERAVEPDAEAKRAWLRQVQAEYGSIDAGGRVVDAVFGGTVDEEELGRAMNERRNR